MSVFQFKHFAVRQQQAALKVGTDAMVFGALLPWGLEGLALDVGTGTGVLSLMLAQRNPGLQITALELDEAAFAEAGYNAEESSFSSQIEVLQGDFLDKKFDERYDLIFSNPPYFQRAYKSENEQKNLARHDDSLPLVDFIPKVSALLKPQGQFWLILPDDLWGKLLTYAKAAGLYLQQEILIFGKETMLSRRVGCFGFAEVPAQTSNLVIRNEDGTYSEAYKTLTRDFHDREL